MIITKAKYIASAVSRKNYPSPLPEVAFFGRSNVGKSSLINSLTGVKNLARTSGKPGKTQTINFFEITGKWGEGEEAHYRNFHLVDLPGYGYAKVGKDKREVWQKFIEEYLVGSENLLFVALLVDIRHEAMEIDRLRLTFLAEHDIPVLVIATKSDKLSKSAAKESVRKLREAFRLPEDAVLAYSSEKNTGREELLQALDGVLHE